MIGKPVGFLGATWLMIRSGLGELPQGVRWSHLIGAACLNSHQVLSERVTTPLFSASEK
ncbi:MAG: Na+/H+ antiporter NhaA [Chloroflexota bacterium]